MPAIGKFFFARYNLCCFEWPNKNIKTPLLCYDLKSITNSKKVVNIINKYEHCAGYATIEELETEATFTSTNQAQVCPKDTDNTELTDDENESLSEIESLITDYADVE